MVQGKLSEIKELTAKLASRFCEPDNAFKLEECFSTFNTFCQKVKQCQKVICFYSFYFFSFLSWFSSEICLAEDEITKPKNWHQQILNLPYYLRICIISCTICQLNEELWVLNMCSVIFGIIFLC